MKIVLLCRSLQCLFLFDPLLIKHVQNLKGADTHVTQFGIYNKILNKADKQTFDYFSRGAGQKEQCHLWLLSWTLCGHNIHHTHKVNLHFTPVFKNNYSMQPTHNLADVAPCTTSSTWSYLVCWSPPWLFLDSRFHRIRGRNSHWVRFEY